MITDLAVGPSAPSNKRQNLVGARSPAALPTETVTEGWGAEISKVDTDIQTHWKTKSEGWQVRLLGNVSKRRNCARRNSWCCASETPACLLLM